MGSERMNKTFLLGILLVSASHGDIARCQVTAAASNNWESVGGNSDESGFSRLSDINKKTVNHLGLAWSLALPGEKRALEATPLAVDGTLYFSGTLGEVYSVDAVSGKLNWKYDPELSKYAPERMASHYGANRGVAYAAGRIFVCTIDGRLVALAARTGKPVWSVNTLPPDLRYASSGAPRTFNGKVIIGNSGADFGARGYVTAYDQATGSQVWRFYTVPGTPAENAKDPAMARAAETWGGEYWKTGTGGTVWNGITFDPELNQIYIGTGNAGPYDPAIRSPGGGDTLYVASIVALNADTGKYLWHYQVNPREGWDYKATANMISATLTIDGKPRKVLMQAPTNGFFYVLDRVTGKLLSAEKTGKVTWADRIDLKSGRPVEMPNIRYETGESVMWPSFFGTHNWQPMSFNPDVGLVYIPFMQVGARYTKSGHPKAQEINFGGLTLALALEGPEDGKGSLLAWDPVLQEARWRVPLDTFWNGGTLSTAGDLVFQGTGGGEFAAYDAADGHKLWAFDAKHGIVGAPITYRAAGRQYVSVLVGYGGAIAASPDITQAGWKYGAQPRRLLTFALGGNAVLPPTPPRDMNTRAVDDDTLVIDEKAAAAGQKLYMSTCFYCHGSNLHSVGVAPDLRESSIPLAIAGFRTVLKDGVLMKNGMPRFDKLSDDEIQQLYMYIRRGAREALGKREASRDSSAGTQ